MPGDLGYISWYLITGVAGLLDGKNRVILRSLVWSQYQRVTDGHAAYS